jgi:hypothetical protein
LTNGAYTLAVSDTNLFAGTDNGGVFFSTNSGATWYDVSTGLRNITVYSLAVSGTNLFAGTLGGGVLLSTNNGTNWAPVNTGLTSTQILSLAVSGTNIFAGTDYGGVCLSTNNGTSWTAVSTGLTYTSIQSLAIFGTNIFAGTYPSGVWIRPLSQMLTSVETSLTNFPSHFSLAQNYPNPFNPATTISFTVPSKSFVSLKIFDALGREVSVLLSEELLAGGYSRQWDAATLPSGIYFYRLQCSSFTETKKLVLLR